MISEWPSSIDEFASSSSRKRKQVKINGSKTKEQTKSESMWVDKFKPINFDELAVHKKKVAEVEAWISHSKSVKKRNAPILLMTGPSGCGKTATLQVAAGAHSFSVQEWTNPLSISFDTSREAGIRHVNLTSQFEEFLFRSGRYPSLEFGSRTSQTADTKSEKLLLIEDLPHHIIREPTSFRDVLREYKLHQKYPLVIILSDGSIPDSVKRNLLPPDVVNQLNIHTIRFNPVVTTAMNKLLTKISNQEKRRVSKDILTAVIESSSGDIRAAINSLQFHLQKGTTISLTKTEKHTSKSKSFKRRKSVDITESNSVIAGKDISLVLFRALGKILYCKRQEPNPRVPPLPQHLEHFYRDPLLLEPENILEHCCLSGSAYSLFLHHNCVPFFSKIDDLTSALDYLCTADVVSTRNSAVDFSSDSSKYLDLYEGSLSARAVAFCNSDRATLKHCEEATGRWRPLHKPSWYQVSRKLQENEASGHHLFWSMNMPSRELLLNLLPYVNKMMSLRNNNVMKSTNSAFQFDRSQRDFLSSVIYLPKWKSFSRYFNSVLPEK